MKGFSENEYLNVTMPSEEQPVSDYRECDWVVTVRIQGKEFTFTTIGREKPVGICGSGIIDLLAQMRKNGWLDISGTLEPGACCWITNG